MAQNNWAKAIFSSEARKNAFQENGYTCFEEDAAATLAIRELLDKNLCRYQYPFIHESIENLSRMINRTIQEYYPEYWQARQKKLESKQKEGQARTKTGRAQGGER